MTSDLRGDAIKPRSFDVDRPARRLRIDWADGHHTEYDFTTLRWLCPCAFCRGEAGQPGWLDSNPTLSEDQTTLVDASLVGHYAFKPVWADGHATGFYTYEHLRRNCPCLEDSTRRASAAQGGDAPPHDHD
jgi:DUF971 family protein